MGLKQKLGMGVMSAALGISLVGGGTFAYFSDSAETNSTFAAGELDLSAHPTTIVDVENLKPGDKVFRTFNLKNGGTLDIGEINLDTSYKVDDSEDNSQDFGKYIEVKFLENKDKDSTEIWHTTLQELKSMDPDVVENKLFLPWLAENDGLKAGDSDELHVAFEFVDNGKDQNEFQGDSLELTWTFEGQQTEGEWK